MCSIQVRAPHLRMYVLRRVFNHMHVLLEGSARFSKYRNPSRSAPAIETLPGGAERAGDSYHIVLSAPSGGVRCVPRGRVLKQGQQARRALPFRSSQGLERSRPAQQQVTRVRSDGRSGVEVDKHTQPR